MLIKIKFLVPAQIKNKLGKREIFKPGIYDLDEEVANHWFVQGLIAGGRAQVLTKGWTSSVVKPEQPAPVKKVGPVPVQQVGPAKGVTLSEPPSEKKALKAEPVQEELEIEEIKPRPRVEVSSVVEEKKSGKKNLKLKL